MPGFTQTFGGNTLYPAEPDYLQLALAADTELQWPIEQQVGGDDVLAKIIEVTAAAGLSVTMPDARQGSTGYATMFYNAGVNTFTVKSNTGVVLVTVASGEAWTLYLRDNSTQSGAWRSFEQGAGTSSANAGALAGAGLKAITTTLNQDMPVNEINADGSWVDGDRAGAFLWTGGTGTYQLPDPAVVGNGWYIQLRNGGSGSLTVSAVSGDIDDSATKIFALNNSAFLVSDGTDYYSVGFGQQVNSVFDFISINAAGTGDLVLSGVQLNRISYRFTGILTGDRNIVVPDAVQQYWVENATTGAFTFRVKTAGQVVGVEVPQTQRRILYSNGVDVVSAETFIVSTPVAVSQGGTGLITVDQGDLLYGSATDVYSRLPKDATATRYLSNTGAGNNPAWAQVNLANGVTGNLPVTNLNSGTGASASTVWRGDGTWGVAAVAADANALGGFAAAAYPRLAASNTFSGVNNFTNVNSFVKKVYSPFIVLTDAATVALDTDLGNNFRVTLGGNRTMGVASNVSDGQRLFLEVIQDGTGNRTLSFPAQYQFSDGVAPVLKTAAGAIDLFDMVYDATSATFRVTHWQNQGPSGNSQYYGTNGAGALGFFNLASSLGFKIAFGRVDSTGVLLAGSLNITSATRTGLGAYTVDFTAAGFTSIPAVVVTTLDGLSPTGCDLETNSTTQVTLTTWGLPGAGAGDFEFNLIAFGL